MSKRVLLDDALGVIAEVPGKGAVFAVGDVVPTDGWIGYAPGCVFLQTDATTVAQAIFTNVGTDASCQFVQASAVTNPLTATLSTNGFGIATAETVASTIGTTAKTSFIGKDATLSGTITTVDLTATGLSTFGAGATINAAGTGTFVALAAGSGGAFTVFGSGAAIASTLTATQLLPVQLSIGPKATESAYSNAMTIDVTKSLHTIAGVNGTSASVALTPSAAGSDGDELIIRTTASGGTITATFASTFHSTGTQATTIGAFSTITFRSDGTRWLEESRVTSLT